MTNQKRDHNIYILIRAFNILFSLIYKKNISTKPSTNQGNTNTFPAKIFALPARQNNRRANLGGAGIARSSSTNWTRYWKGSSRKLRSRGSVFKTAEIIKIKLY
jgi:hypothetical protein